MVIHCYAKINLTLEILGKRADGYHEVRTVMQTVGLADRLEVSAAADLSFTCSDPALATPDNLVYRAARLLQADYGARAGAALRLEKRIPVAAGMGGGSSDAAATIVALNRLWNLQLSPTEQRRLAAALGSDVPFFLTGGTALATGRGERITPLPPLPQYWIALRTAAPRAKHGGGLPSRNPRGLHRRRRHRRRCGGGAARYDFHRRPVGTTPLNARPRK